jgi:hypothetical protein
MVVGGGVRGGVSYSFTENFEGPGFENVGWGETYFTDDYATAPAPLVGSYSGFFAHPWGGETAYATSPTFTEINSTADIYFQFHITEAAKSSEGFTLTGRNTNTDLFTVNVTTYDVDNTRRTITLTLAAGTPGNAFISGWEFGTKHFWFTYTPGSPASLSVYISSNATKPASADLTVNDVNVTGKLNRVHFSTYDWAAHIIDKIRIDDETIGSSPE